ncbi:MAG TPA: PEP-CTERM sorting domain-containing protein [Bryobacteraceae bacterium]|nr:PEP-CTERM sorting domain-containing protein [Bryobacteraceae bacterium]
MRSNRSEKSEPESAVLASRLSGYSTGAKVAAAARRLRGRAGNWPIYAAAAGSALAMTTSASASIISGVYPGGGPHGGVSVRPGPGGLSTQAPLSEFSPVHLLIKAGSGSSFAALSVLAFGAIDVFVTGVSNLSAKNFAAGSRISHAAGSLLGSARIVNASFSGSNFGRFHSGEPGYVGFAIGLGGGNVDYGWLKLVFTTDPNTHRPQILEALAWGIETTPNEGIDAGAVATPEPGTMALGILAAGAAGVLALRRRRSA